MNIIGNSIDSIENEGEISIGTKYMNGTLEVSIKDSGKGMESQIKDKIFDPFFTTKDIGQGTGLGLSITYGIIEEHNGEVNVNSKLGKGTEFIIKFPVEQ
jgi:signal transduction histidine kinase